MDRKVAKHLNRVKADQRAVIKNGKPVIGKDGKVEMLKFDRQEFASEVAKRLGVTRRTVRKARQGMPAALARVAEKLTGESDE